jgi:hypothetical protein
MNNIQLNKYKLKNISYVLIILQILDVFTTYIGVSLMGCRELNPLDFTFQTVILKIFVTIFIVLVFENIKIYKVTWVIPGIMLLVVIWNFINIFVELLFKIL